MSRERQPRRQSDVPKRYRTLKAKPGELRVYYGKADRWSGPDVCFAWGDGVQKPDAHLLYGALSMKRMTTDFPNTGHKWDPSLIEELEARGYDIATLRFSISKKAQP